MTLRETLLARIAAQGPLTLADYMEACLLDPTYGYYATRDPFGAGGDFTTAPEISQMFGEMIGLALAQSWMDQGAPSPFTLAEAGPGRGTLMADILRATRGVDGLHEAMRIVLIEASPTLRTIQGDTLAEVTPAWTTSFDDLPKRPLWFVANEFFDALPVRQFRRDPAGWSETLITVEGDRLARAYAAPAPVQALAARMEDTQTGDIVELRPTAGAIMGTIGARIHAHGGAALIIDYGGWRSLGDTFQALQGHDYVDPLADPGAADLTAHVDFEALARAALPAKPSELTPQGVFLERLGITARAQALATRLGGEALTSHIAAHRRLTHPEEMGTLFKILALTAPAAPPVPGTEYPGRPAA